MAATASIGVSVKTLFIVLFCVMVAAFAYLFLFGDFFSCFDIHARWYKIMMADFTTCAVVIGVWIAYKESSWIIAFVVIAAMQVLGSFVSLGYILTQFYKLSHEEYLKDPLYFVLARSKNRDVNGGSFVVAARVLFSVLGCLVLGTLIYTIIEELTHPIPNISILFEIDVYILVAIFAVWIAYKESSWKRAFLWIVLLVCLRGVTICVYIVRQLYGLLPQQPASLILFNTNRDIQSSDPRLMEHPDYA
ncbi:hypothetical protein HanIR_Chr15g0768271 [Helianthus annuus]|nr:hypothetical protein HanIR_Chr15g0768271 [Helianthus annuus]